jgi:hypothetical protein
VGILCLLLLSISAAAQVHLHPDDLSAGDRHCALCQVAHSAPQIVAVMQLDVALIISAYLAIAPDSDRQSTFDLGWHFSRPPPQA